MRNAGSGFRDISSIGLGNRVPGNEFHLRCVSFVQIADLPSTGDVMGAANHRLHPAEARIARRTDLRFLELFQGQLEVSIATFVQEQAIIAAPGTHQLVFVTDVDEKIIDLGSPRADGRITRPHDANSIQQAKSLIHLQAEISDIVRCNFLEVREQLGGHALFKLRDGFSLPVRQNALCKKGRELFLELVNEGEIDST